MINGSRVVAVGIMAVLGLVLVDGVFIKKGETMESKLEAGVIQMPRPVLEGGLPLEQALLNRRSQRNFADRPLTLSQVSRLLWAAQGLTGESGYRTAPSAGALYPLEVYLFSGRTEGLAPGAYHYDPGAHQLLLVKEGDQRPGLCRAALSQQAVAAAAACLVITAVAERTTAKYGQRGLLYVLMEIGHAGQNILLEAESLGLGAVPIGAFTQNEVNGLLELGRREQAFYIIPVGYPAE